MHPESGDDSGAGHAGAATPEQLRTLFHNMGRGTLAERMGVEILEVAPERVEGRMPVAGNTQPYGLLHGGASVVLAETLGSIAAGLHAWPDRMALGIEINATHHRSARQGWVTGVATPVAAGRSLATYDVVITDDAGRRICTARLTCVLREPKEQPSSVPG